LNTVEELSKRIKGKIKFYQKMVKKDYLNHLKTRRLGAVSFLFGMMGLATVIVDKYSGLNFNMIQGADVMTAEKVGLTLVTLSLIFVVLIFFSHSKKMICFFYCTFFILSAAVLLVTNSTVSGYIFAGIYLALYLCCYGLNRQQGYSKLWARHQRLVTQLELLEWNFKFDIEEASELENRLKKHKLEFITGNARAEYLDILKKHAFERQADIVGDYLSTNDAAFSWVKSLKK